MTATDEDEFSEIFDARFSRVDLVQTGANGIPLLIAKQDASAGLLPPDYVRDLIAKAEPETSGRERVEMPNGITVTGSPAAMAAFIHSASVRKQQEDPEAAEVAKALAEYEAVIKAKYTAEERRQMASRGEAMDGGAYPIGDEADLEKAIRAVGRGGADHDAIRRHVIKRAKSLGKSSMIPDNWAADGSLKEKVSKADSMITSPDLDEGTDGMDPTVPFTAPDDDDAPGDPSDPGSPAWEGIDAATARKWLSIASRLRNALGLLADREMLEASVADPSDADSAMNLQDAQCAVDYVIETLAVFAAQEQAETELGTEMAEAVKALAGSEAALGTVEALSAVRKAGRVLSTANEAAIRAAVESLQKVLASLPEAPVAKEAAMAEDQAAEVAKETQEADMPQAETSADRTAESGQAPVMGAMPGKDGKKGKVAKAVAALPVLVFGQDRALLGSVPQAAVVMKADGDGEGKTAMQAVFDEKGNLVGIVDPADITPVAGATPKSDDMTDAEGGGSMPEPSAAPADSMQPAPAASTGTPAAGVAKGEETTAGTAPAPEAGKPKGTGKKKIAKALKALEAQEAARQEVVAKMAADRDGQAQEIEALRTRLETVEKTAAPPRVFANGQVPSGPIPAPAQLRGQDSGTPPVDVAKAAELKRTLYTGTAREQNQAFGQMQELAVAGLQALHAAGPGRPA